MIQIRFKARPSWRESAHLYQGRVLLVALEPCAVLVRQKGRRAVYRVPIESIFKTGAVLEARRIMFEKKQAKKEGKKS